MRGTDRQATVEQKTRSELMAEVRAAVVDVATTQAILRDIRISEGAGLPYDDEREYEDRRYGDPRPEAETKLSQWFQERLRQKVEGFTPECLGMLSDDDLKTVLDRYAEFLVQREQSMGNLVRLVHCLLYYLRVNEWAYDKTNEWSDRMDYQDKARAAYGGVMHWEKLLLEVPNAFLLAWKSLISERTGAVGSTADFAQSC